VHGRIQWSSEEVTLQTTSAESPVVTKPHTGCVRIEVAVDYAMAIVFESEDNEIGMYVFSSIELTCLDVCM